MDRRAFLGTLAGSVLAVPLAAEAQQAGKGYRIVGLWTNPSPRWRTCCGEAFASSAGSKAGASSSSAATPKGGTSGTPRTRPNCFAAT
jgi:hypothetical protein